VKDQIEQYEPSHPQVVAIGDHRLRAFVGDDRPRLESTLWVGEVATRIVTLGGSRRVEAIAFDTGRIAVGDPVRCEPAHAEWPAPIAGVTELGALAFAPGRDAAVAPTATRDVSALQTSIEVLDDIVPIAYGGVTLVLDPGAPDTAFDRVLAGASPAPCVVASQRVVPGHTHQIVGANGLALALAAQWARELDATLVIEAAPFDIDELLDGAKGITAIIRIHLRDGLEILAESLDLGHSDAQLVLRADGRIDLSRSTSRHGGDPARFAQLAEVREKLEIFGEHDLDEDDLALLREADRLEDQLRS
jgi:hypothetical protein